jgi:hypothetical protein
VSWILNWECHKNTFVEVFFHATIGLIPLAAVVVMLLFGKWEGWGFFWANGEFYIYSVAFLAMSLYTLFNLGLKKDNLGNLLTIFIVLSLIVSVLMYGALIYTKITNDGVLPDESVLANSSLILLSLSILFFYITTYWNNYLDFVVQTSTGRSGVDDIKRGLN